MIEFEVKYEAGHSYRERWERIDCFCPKCGTQSVWHDMGGGDYYVDERYMCRDCGAAFHLPGGVSVPHEKDRQSRQRIEAIRASDQPSESEAK